MNRFTLLSALVLCTSALAQNVYRYKDAEGVDHYTNDLNTIPTSASVVPTSGAELSELSVGKDAKAKAPAPKVTTQELQDRKLYAEVRRAEADARLAEAQERNQEQQSEEYWRSLFRASRARVDGLEFELNREREVIARGLPVPGRYVVYGQVAAVDVYAQTPAMRVADLERQLKLAREENNELERRASFAAVPRHWRQ